MSWCAKFTGSTPQLLTNGEKFACVPGDVVTASCMVKKTSGTSTGGCVTILWLDIGFGLIGSANGNLVTSSSYAQSRVSAMAPATTAFAQVCGSTPSLTGSCTFYFDAFMAAWSPNSLDEIPDGTVYAKVLYTMVNNGVPTSYTGDWDYTKTYAVGMECTSGGSYWKAKAISTNSLPAAGANWVQMGAAANYLGAYAGGTTYLTNQTVSYSSKLYTSLQDTNVGHTPDVSPTWWSQLGAGISFLGAYSGSTPYLANQMVSYANSVWLAMANSTGSTPALGNGDWQVIGSMASFTGAYAGGTTYSVGQEVSSSGAVYISLVSSNTGHTPASSPTYWQSLGGISYTGAYNGSTTYSPSQECDSGGNIWYCLVGCTGSTPAIGNSNWLIMGPASMDAVAEGSTYGKVALTSLTSGNVDLALSGVAGRNLGNIGDATGRYAIINAGSMKGVSSVDSGNLALIDFTSGHTNKTLDYLPDGSTYARPLASSLTLGVPYTLKGAWASGTVYKVGDEVTYTGNYWKCAVANTGGVINAPSTANGWWTRLGATSLDSVEDGSTYAKPKAAYLTAGVPYTYRGAYSSGTTYVIGDEVTLAGVYYVSIQAANTNHAPNLSSSWWTPHGPVTMDDVADGVTYGGIKLASLTTGNVDLAKSGVAGRTLTNIADVAGRYAVTNIGSGKAVASVDAANLALIDFTQAGHSGKTLTNIADAAGRYAVVNIGSGKAVASVDAANLAMIDFTQSHTGKSLTNIPDAAGRYAVTNMGSGKAVASVDSNNKALIDFTQAGHSGKTLTNIADATGRYAVTNIGSGKAVASVDAANLALIDFTQTHTGKSLTNIPDATGRYAVTNIGSGKAVASVDAANLALIDFTQAGHSGKNIDNLADGSTYGRPLASKLTSGVPNTYRGAWAGSTSYLVGDEIAYPSTAAGNYYRCITANSDASWTIAKWLLMGPASHDLLADGSTYGGVKLTALTTGTVDLSKAGVVGKTLTNIADATGRYATTNISGKAVASVDTNNLALIDFTQAGHTGKTLTNIADATGRYAVTNIGSGKAVASVDAANLALIDFTQAGHSGKNLDNLADGSTYGRPLASKLTSGVPNTYRGAWVTLTSYLVGDEIAYPSTAAGNYYRCITANSDAAWTTAKWLLMGPASHDLLADGTTYGGVKLTALTTGTVDLAKAGVVGKTLTNIADAAGRYATTNISGKAVASVDANNLALIDFTQAGHTGKTHDNIADGTTYGGIKLTALTTGTVDLAKAGVVGKTLTNIADATGRYATTNISGKAVASVDSNNLALVDFTQAGHTGKTLTNIADATGRYAVTNIGSGKAVASVDAANLALIDFTQAGHSGKNLDNLADGATYARPLATALTSGAVDLTKAGVVGKPVVMVINPDFESGNRDWVPQTGWSVQSGNTYSGTYSAKYTGSGTGSAIVNSNYVAVQPGDTLIATCMAKLTAGTGSIGVAIAWWNASTVWISNSIGNGISSSSYGTSRVVGVAPAGAVWATIIGIVTCSGTITGYADTFNLALGVKNLDEVADSATYLKTVAAEKAGGLSGLFPTATVNTAGYADVTNDITPAPAVIGDFIPSALVYSGPVQLDFDVWSTGSGNIVDILLYSGTSGGSGVNGYFFRFDSRNTYISGQILKVANGTWATIGTAEGSANSGNLAAGWNHVTATWTITGHFDIYVNGAWKYTALDSTYLLNGIIGYGEEGGASRLRNFAVASKNIVPAANISTSTAKALIDFSESHTNKTGANITYTSGGGTLDSLKPAESGAEATTGKSISILVDGGGYIRPTTNQGTGATRAYSALNSNNMLTNSYVMPPVNSASTTVTVPCTQTAGSHTINIAAFALQTGPGQINYSSGSVTPATYGNFYVYMDDPTYAGGAVSYSYTSTTASLVASDGRVCIGSITTLAGGSLGRQGGSRTPQMYQ